MGDDSSSGEVVAKRVLVILPNAFEVFEAAAFIDVLGWANHFVVPEQPDLVLLYGIGLESDLEKIF